jgi:hypothetical protein
MSHERILALLGQRDEPTDALADYCRYLGEALVNSPAVAVRTFFSSGKDALVIGAFLLEK